MLTQIAMMRVVPKIPVPVNSKFNYIPNTPHYIGTGGSFWEQALCIYIHAEHSFCAHARPYTRVRTVFRKDAVAAQYRM